MLWFFFFNDTATTEIYTLSLHDALPIWVADALELAQKHDFDAAICDVQLPDGDGLNLLRRLQQINPAICGLIITAYATIENAVDAFKAGAFDYLVKPVIFDDLDNKLRRVFEYRMLLRENQQLRRELNRLDQFDQIIGSSGSILELQRSIAKVAVTNSNVLLVGETGTGKELAARAVHATGPKKHEKFLAVNCGTRPPELLEAQLFGCESTGGNGAPSQPGILRAAGEGTVYLDEIAHLPMGTQTQLLRAIEYQESMPTGGSETYPVHARIIAATALDLMRLVGEGQFQEDLFYRIDGVKLRVPPLRERLDDIPELVEAFIARSEERRVGKECRSRWSPYH